MEFIDVARRVIPGYHWLTQEEQKEFEKTAEGLLFVNQIKKIQETINSFVPNNFWWSLFFVDSKKEQEKEKIEAEFEKQKNALITDINSSKAYKMLIAKIVFTIIVDYFPELRLFEVEKNNLILDNNDENNASWIENRFLKTELVQNLGGTSLIAIEIELQELRTSFLSIWGSREPAIQNRIDELEEEKETILQNWHKEFLSDDSVGFYRNALKKQIIDERLDELAKAFPSLNNLEEIDRQDFNESYNEVLVNDLIAAKKMEQGFLINFLYRKLQNAVANQINFLPLNNFNLKQAEHLAKQIIAASNKNKSFKINDWLNDYQRELTEHILKQLKLINGKPMEVKEPAQLTELYNSFSYIFWNNVAIKGTTDFLNRLSDAHAFLQYTGMAAQNDSYTALLDIYQTNRLAAQVLETKSIIFSLFNPFVPLYEEYRNIAFYEKSFFNKVYRIVMPLLIIAGLFVLVGAVFAPLAIPEIVFIVAAIPLLFIGLALATQYVVLKNFIHQKWQQSQYGGPFEIPEYQINDRMVRIFGSEDMAEMVRLLYIEEIKICECNEIESQKNPGGNETKLKARKANMDRRHGLNIEWYDIHSNESLAFEDVRQIVIKRLTEITNKEYQKLEKELTNNDLEQITTIVATIRDDLENTFSKSEKLEDNILIEPVPPQVVVPNINIIHSPQIPVAIEEVVAENVQSVLANPPASLGNPQNAYSPQFFTPNCLRHRVETARMELMSAEITRMEF